MKILKRKKEWQNGLLGGGIRPPEQKGETGAGIEQSAISFRHGIILGKPGRLSRVFLGR
jgi:hypothetical protein